MSRAGSLIAGALIGALLLAPLGIYLLARLGAIAMATTAKPLPLEATIAHTALSASLGNASQLKDPLDVTESNLLSGAHLYSSNCAVCHGIPNQSKTAIAAGEFPPPPQLFQPDGMVADDPQGTTYWKITNGIRLSGMPGFANTLSDTERWQLAQLLANAKTLPPSAQAALAFDQPLHK